jgi:protein SCO1/2
MNRSPNRTAIRTLGMTVTALCLSQALAPARAHAAGGLAARVHGAAAPAAAPLPDSSLYQLGSEWTTDAGARIRLESLRGKIRVLTLFFGHCESSCPMVLGSLKAMEAALPADWGAKGGIVLVSLDPERDDAESLADYRRRMDLDPERWTLLKGNLEDTRELAMALGVAYRKSRDNGGMDHNAVVVVLDGEGRILKRHEGVAEGRALSEEFRAAAYRSAP